MRVGAAVAAAGAILSCAAAAQAQRPADLGAGAPTGQMGVQLYDWNNYLSRNGEGEIVCPAPPEPALNTAGLQTLRALGDSYGLRFVSRPRQPQRERRPGVLPQPCVGVQSGQPDQ